MIDLHRLDDAVALLRIGRDEVQRLSDHAGPTAERIHLAELSLRLAKVVRELVAIGEPEPVSAPRDVTAMLASFAPMNGVPS